MEYGLEALVAACPPARGVSRYLHLIMRCLGIVEQISGKIWHNRGFNDKSVKTSKIVHLDLLNKIGYGPIA